MNFKKRILILFLVEALIFSSLFFPLNNTSFAQQTEIQYPAIWDLTPPSSLVGWIHYILKLLMLVAIILAVLQIVWAGIKYISSSVDPSQKQDAKDRLENAILGFVLLFFFYVILNTLSPMFVNLYLKTPAESDEWGLGMPDVIHIPGTWSESYPITEFYPPGIGSEGGQDGVPHFFQNDDSWGNIHINGATIASAGCFITSIAMVVSYFYGRNIYPDQVLRTLKSQGCITDSSVSSEALVRGRCNYNEVKFTKHWTRKISNINKCLMEGGKVIVKVKKSKYTSSNTHFFVLTGYHLGSDGKIIYHVNDPIPGHIPTRDGIITPDENLSGALANYILCCQKK